MGFSAFFSFNFLTSLIAFAIIVFFTVFCIFAFLLISFFQVINEVLLSWIIDHGQSQPDVEAGETTHLRQSDDEPFIEEAEEAIHLRQSDDEPFNEDNAIQANATLMRIFWMEVLARYRREYLEEKEEQKQCVLNMLSPPVKYKRQEGLSGWDECVICLEDFFDGDSCRILPLCKHNFHLDCIDSWLKNGRANCPICRQHVV